MVWHLVLLKARTGLSAEERQALISAFDKAVREIPTVRDVHLGRRITHGAGYEATAPDAADFMVSIAFDDLPGLQAYLNHPAHQETRHALLSVGQFSGCIRLRRREPRWDGEARNLRI